MSSQQPQEKIISNRKKLSENIINYHNKKSKERIEQIKRLIDDLKKGL